jgi:hypothetical protein
MCLNKYTYILIREALQWTAQMFILYKIVMTELGTNALPAIVAQF